MEFDCSDLSFQSSERSLFPSQSYAIKSKCSVSPFRHLEACVRFSPKVVTTLSLKFSRLRLHGAIYRPDLFVLMLLYCTNL